MKNQHATTKLSIILLLTFSSFTSFGQMFVSFPNPSSNQAGISVDSDITLNFTENVDQTTIDNDTPGDFTDDNIRVFGSLSGRIEGTFSGGGTSSIVFDPTVNFKEGEKIIVYVTQAVQSTTATAVLPSFLEFHVGGAPATGAFPSLNAITGTTAFITSDIELGDLDNDGILDLVTATSGGIYVAYGNGTGDFGAPVQETSSPAAFVELADFNQDGLTDIVVATESGNPYTINIFLNDGVADPQIFPSITSTVSNAAGGINPFIDIGVGDFTRDGVPDVIAGHRVSAANAVEIYSVDGATGTFLSTASSAFGNINAGNFIIGDFDNSGTEDFIITISSGANSINFNNSAGVGDPTFNVVSSGISMEYGKTADFNGDGFLDLAYFLGGQLQVRQGNGSQTPSFPVGYSIVNDSERLAIGDINGDGQLDIMTVGSSGTRRVYINTGSLTFSQSILSSLTFMSDVELGDLNGDGILDAVLASDNVSVDNRVSLGEAPPALVTVTTDSDTGAGSLRQAIADVANGGTIQFDAGLAGAPIRLSSILLVQKDLTFDGQGQDIILSGDTDASATSNIGDSQIMSVDEGFTVSFSSITFEFGFVDGDLGGALLLNAGSNVSISECTFRRNTASGVGGAAAAIAVALSDVNIDRCVFEDNIAFEGGGAIYQVANDDSNNITNIYNSSFINNQVGNATGFGGAVAIAGGSSGTNTIDATIYNCTFYLNSAGGQGGALLLGNVTSTPSSTHTFTLSNNTFYNNNSTTANQGDDIYVGPQGDLSLANTLIANDENTALFIDAFGTISSASNNIIAQQPSTFGAINTGTLFLTDILNTSLVTGVNGIPVLEILPDGPAFDAGTNVGIQPDVLDLDGDLDVGEDTPIDAAGNPRAWDPVASGPGTVDIGATESQALPSLKPLFLDAGFTPKINQTVTSGAVPSIIFDADVDLASAHAGTNPGTPALVDMLDDNVIVTGEHSGRMLGTYSQISGSAAIDFFPNSTLKAGETITISVTDGVLGTGGQAADPFVYQYSLFSSPTSPGNFPLEDVYVGTTGTQNGAVADLNGDGFLDIITVSDAEGCRALINDGSGGFTITTVGPADINQRAIALGDIDNDGDIDAFFGIGANASPAADQIWKNDGSGSFTLHQTLPFTSQIDAVALGDLDGDGDLDAFQNLRDGSNDLILFNDGNGTFTDSGQTPVTGTNGGAVALGDIDNDGDLDAFVGQNSGGADELWINNGDGFFTIYPQTFGTGWANDVVLGDFDGDFDLDVFVSTENAENDEIWRNSDGAGNFVQVPLAFGLAFTSGADFGDIDGDNTLDILSTNGIWTNDGAGNFSSFFSGFSGTGTPVASFLADFDNDFDLDPVIIYGDETKFYLNNEDPPFVTTWNTNNTGPGTTSATEVLIPLEPSTTYNFTVDWGDGSASENFSGLGSTLTPSHDYTSTGGAGTYSVSITGTFPRIYFNGGGDAIKLISIDQWGSVVWGSFMDNAFNGCTNLTSVASSANGQDDPDFSGVTDAGRMFFNCTSFNNDISSWDVANIQQFTGMFEGATLYNSPLNAWTVDGAQNMSGMFASTAFDQPLSSWGVESVLDMSNMFFSTPFNQDISSWSPGAVQNFSSMFEGNTFFNQAIGLWGSTGAATDLSRMFFGATAFNHELSSWDVSAVTNFSQMFEGAAAFNNGQLAGQSTAPLNWTMATSAANMAMMFRGASIFNQSVNSWTVTNVTFMDQMFQNATDYDQPLNLWNTALVQNFGEMFAGATSFNQDISSWNLSSAANLGGMFSFASTFNQPLDAWGATKPANAGIVNLFESAVAFDRTVASWDVSGVSDMFGVFKNATAFDQDLSSWDVTAVTSGGGSMGEMLDNSGISTSNYDAILNGWAGQLVQNNVTLGANGLIYSSAGAPGRATLTGTNTWTINGDATPALAPTNFIAYESGGNIVLEWADNAIDESGFLVERADDYAFTTNVTDITIAAGSPGIDATTATYGPLGIDYYYRVTAVNGFEDATSRTNVEFASPNAFPGQALSFDGAVDSEVISDNANLDYVHQTGVFSIEFWMKIDALATQDQMVVGNAFNGSDNGFFIDYNNNAQASQSLGIFVSNGAGTTLSSGYTGANYVDDNLWHYYAVVSDGANVTIYKDGDGGTSLGTISASSGSAATNRFSIGGADATTGLNFAGSIDEIRFWDDVRLPAELDASRYSFLQGNEANLVAYYPLDEGVGSTNTLDRSVNIGDGLLNGGITPEASGVPLGPPPVAPSNFIAYESGGNIVLEWVDNASDETGFLVERADDYAFTTNVLDITTAAGNPGIDATTATYDPLGLDYYYRVTAVNGFEDASSRTNVEFASPIAFPGQALSFASSTANYVRATTLVAPSSNYTYEFWMRPASNLTSASPRSDFFDFMTGVPTVIFNREGDGTIRIYDPSLNTAISSNTSWDAGRWYHIAATYDGTNINIYVDGVLDDSFPTSFATSASDLIIGNSNSFNTGFDGAIEEFRIWNFAKTDFSDRFNSLQGNEANLVAYYSFDEGVSASSAVDRSVNTNDGTLNGSIASVTSTVPLGPPPVAPSNFIAYESGGNIVLEWVDNASDETGFLVERADDYAFTTNVLDITAAAGNPGIDATTATYDPSGIDYYYRVTAVNGFEDATSQSSIEFASSNAFPGQMLSFDGSNDYIEVADSDDLSFGNGSTDSPFSIEFWVNFNVLGQNQVLVNKRGATATDREYVTQILSTDRIQFSVFDGSASGFLSVETNAFTPNVNQWYHMAFTYDGSAIQDGLLVYIDGVLAPVDRSNLTYTAMENLNLPLEIGANNSFNHLNGQLDEIRIWNDLRTGPEIQGNQYTNFSGNEANLVAYYPFDEGIGATNTVDRSVNVNDGLLNGGIVTLLSDFANPPTITNAIFSDTNGDGDLDQVRLVFDRAVDVLDPGFAADGFDVISLNDGSPVTIDNADYTANGVIQLDLNFLGDQIAGTGVTGITLSYQQAGGSEILSAGSIIEIADAATPSAFTDNAAPTVVSMEIFDNSGDDGRIDRIDITFSENIDTDDSAPPVLGDFGTLLLPDGTALASGTYSDPDGLTNIVSITVISDQLTSNTTTGATGIDGIDGLWRDANPGNLLTATGDDFETIIDSAPATPVGAVTLDTNSDGIIDAVEIQYSEAIADAGVTPGDFTISTDGGSTTDAFDGFNTDVNEIAINATPDDEFFTLTLSTPINVSGTAPAQVSYTSTTSILDAVGNPATNFVNQPPADGANPTVVLSSIEPDPTGAPSFILDVVFSEPVTGLLDGDFIVGNGIATGLTGTGDTYSITITPSADGLVTVDLPAAVAQDAAANDNIAAAQFSITHDATDPTVVLSSIEPDPTGAPSFILDVVFSEPVTGLLDGDFIVGNGIATGLTGTGDTYSITITPTADGLVTVDLPAAVAQDAAANDNTAAAQFSITSDATDPTVVLSSIEPDPTSAPSFILDVVFSEPVTGLLDGDFVVVNGIATGLTGTGDTYSITITPSADGLVTVDLPAAVAQDVAANDNTAAAQFSITNDATDPTVVLSSIEPDPTGAPSFILDVVFSEPVTGLLDGDFIVGNGIATGLTGTGDTYSITITPSADGLVTIDLPAAVAQDVALNDNTAAAQFSITSDATDPTVVLSSIEPDPTGAPSFILDVVFSEPVSGLLDGDFIVGNGIATGLTGTGDTYSITITPSADGLVTVDLPAAVAQDAAANDNAAAAQFSITSDATDPTVVLSSIEPDPTGAPSFILDVVFSEPVTGLLDGDFVVVNGIATGLTGTGDTYSITITPTADGLVTVDLPAAVAQDAAANDNAAAAQFSITSDATDPTVVLSSIEPDPTGAPSFILDVVFSEPVTGLLDGDFIVGNGIATGLTGTGDTYSITITPSADGLVTVDLPAAVAQDAAANDNAAAAQFSITSDATDPTVVLSSIEPDPTGAPSFILDVVFSEPVTGLLDGDFVVVNGIATGLTGTGDTYSITITPTADGLVTVDLPAAVAQDAAANDNAAAAQFSITSDATDPTVVLSSIEPDPTGAPSFILDVVFSEPVTGLLDGDFIVGNGITTGLTGTGDTYSITITPTADGLVTVDLPAAVAQDAAANDNAAAAQFSITSDATDPTVVLSSIEPDPTGAPSFILDVVFSEPVTGLLDGDFIVGNGIATGLTGTGDTYSITITPTADGLVTVDLPAAVAQDAAANDNVAAAQFSITSDATDPTVVLSSIEPDPTGAPSFILDVVFSEPVTGLLDGDFIVGNGIATGLTGTGDTYSITITPTADGLVTVDLPAAVAQDAAANDNAAAAQFSITSDATDPTVVLSSIEPDPTGAPSFILDVVFSEPVTGLLDGDFIVGNGIATGLTGTGDTYSITITPSADGLVTVDLPAAVAQDVALNDNTAAAQFSITYDGSAPTTTSFLRQSPLTALTNADVLVFRVSYSEDVTGVDIADFLVDGVTTATVTNVTPINGSTYDVQVSGGDLAGFDGIVGLNYNTGSVSIQDLSSNPLPDTEPATDETYTLDNSSFSASIVRQSPVSEFVNAVSVIFRVTFSEDVMNVDVTDFTSTLGTVNLVTQNTASEYDVTIIGISGDGLIDLDFSGVQNIEDLTTNPFLGTISVEETYTSDQTDPTVVLSSIEPDPTGAPSFILDVVFSEPVTGLLDGDFIVGNGIATGLTGTGDTYSITITPTADGLVTVDLPAAVAQDAAANDNTAAAQFSITSDATDPTVVLSSIEPDPTSAPSFILDVVFSEPVTGLLDGDFVVVNGIATGLTGTGDTYSITITPSADGLVTVDLPAAVAQDVAANDNTAAAQFSITNDATDPTVVLSSIEPDPTGAPSFILDVVFSEPVTGLLDGDFIVGNGIATGLTGTGDTYSITITPTADGLVTVDLPSAVAQDAAANDNTAAAQFSIAHDATDPTVVLSSIEPDPTGAPSFILDVVFSESVTGLLDGDFVVVNGLASGLTGTGDTYSITITPTADGLVTVDLPAAVAQDAAANDNTAAVQFSITYDGSAPVTTSFLRQSPLTALTNVDVLVFRVSYSEDVTGVDIADFLVDGVTTATVTNVTPINGSTYDVQVSGGDLAGFDGIVGLNYNTGSVSIQDLSSNPLPDTEPATDETYTVNNSSFTATIARLIPLNEFTNAGSVTFRVTFSEDVFNVDVTDFTTTIGTVSNVIPNSAFEYDVTVNGVSGDGLLDIDFSGGQNIENSLTVPFSGAILSEETYTVDNTAPTVTFSSIEPDPTTSTDFVLDVIFSEVVTGLANDDFVVVNGTASGLSGSGNTYSVTITPAVNGLVTVDLPAAVVQDLASNDNIAATQFSITNNQPVPSVTISTLETSPTNTSPILIDILFSENVIGFEIGDVTVGNGTLSNFNTINGATYSADLTPTSDGIVTVDVLGAVAQDISGNDNLPATQLTIEYDATPPTVGVDVFGTSISSPQLTGTIDDNGASIEVNVAGNDYPVTNNGDGTWTLTAGTITPGLSDGTYDVVATATDAVGNVGTDNSTDELIISQTVVTLAAENVTSTSFTARWSVGLDVQNYQLDVSDVADFSTFLTGFQNLETTETSADVTGLDFSTQYYYRVRLVNTSDEVSANSNTRSTKTTIDAETVADSTALSQIYAAINPQGLNWETARLRNWIGVNLDNVNRTRVETVNISATSSSGDMPSGFSGDASGGLSNMSTMNISDNQITGLIDFTGTAVIDLNVSSNSLQFDDLEPIVGISTVDYSNQASVPFNETIGGDQIEVRFMNDFSLSISIDGSDNVYTWFRNDIEISSSENEFLINNRIGVILGIDYNNMGTFRGEVTNSLVPGLTINVDPQEVLAIVDVAVRLTNSNDEVLTGEIFNGALLETVRREQGYDTLENIAGIGSEFIFVDVVLGDYLCGIDPENTDDFIPTYFTNAFQWDEADTLLLRKDTTLTIQMTADPPELTEEDGEGSLEVIIEEDFEDDGGRVDARRRASKRKCGLRRKRTGGRTDQDDEFELIAYGETDENGEFKFGFLPTGTYRFFVEYPGIPIDDSSFVEFEVGEAGISDKDFKLQAFASEDGIEVEIEAVLGVILEYFKNLEIYPNPSSEYLNVSYRHLKSQDVTAQLVDLYGNTKWTQDLRNGFDGELKIDVTTFEEGIYFLRFYDRISPKENVVTFRVFVKK